MPADREADGLRAMVRAGRVRAERMLRRKLPAAQPYCSDPGVVSSSPVSSQVLRPERIIGHPL